MSDASRPSANAGDSSHPPKTDGLLHEKVEFDQPDIAASRVIAVLFAIALVFVGVSLVCRRLLNMNESGLDRAARSPQYAAPADRLPAAPRLESLDRSEMTATSDVFARQLAMEHVLHSYGDTVETGFAHIPIEQAMKLIISSPPVQQKSTPPPAKGFGLVGGGESNSGRLYSEAPTWLREKR